MLPVPSPSVTSPRTACLTSLSGWSGERKDWPTHAFPRIRFYTPPAARMRLGSTVGKPRPSFWRYGLLTVWREVLECKPHVRRKGCFIICQPLNGQGDPDPLQPLLALALGGSYQSGLRSAGSNPGHFCRGLCDSNINTALWMLCFPVWIFYLYCLMWGHATLAFPTSE